jgi:hypothetical protein
VHIYFGSVLISSGDEESIALIVSLPQSLDIDKQRYYTKSKCIEHVNNDLNLKSEINLKIILEHFNFQATDS